MNLLQETTWSKKSNFYWFFIVGRFFSCDFFNCSLRDVVCLCLRGQTHSRLLLNYWYTFPWNTGTVSRYVQLPSAYFSSSRESYQPKYNLHMVDYITHVVGNVEMWSNEFLGRQMCCFIKLICSTKFRLAFSRWCLLCANIVLASFSIPNRHKSGHASSISMQLYHWQQNVFTFFTAALLFRCRFLRNFIFFLLINPVVV